MPGRFNLLEIDGATVVIDYGHNTSALLALIEAIGKLPHQQRHIVYSTAGDRRDCDMIRQGQMLGENFDHVILYEDHYLRGRAEGEIIGLFRKGLASATRTVKIEEIRGAIAAVEAGLHAGPAGQPGGDPGRHHRRDRAVPPPLSQDALLPRPRQPRRRRVRGRRENAYGRGKVVGPACRAGHRSSRSASRSCLPGRTSLVPLGKRDRTCSAPPGTLY